MQMLVRKTNFFRVKLCIATHDVLSSKVFAFWLKTTKLLCFSVYENAFCESEKRFLFVSNCVLQWMMFILVIFLHFGLNRQCSTVFLSSWKYVLRVRKTIFIRVKLCVGTHDVHSRKDFAFGLKLQSYTVFLSSWKCVLRVRKTIFIRVKLCVAMNDVHSSKVFAFWFKSTMFYSVSQFIKMCFESEKDDFYSCHIVCCIASSTSW
jgi:hypothetical protein